MKRIISVFLVFAILVTGMSISASAMGERKAVTKAYDEDIGTLSFDCYYAETGKKITASVEGYDSSAIKFFWYIDRKCVSENTDNYTLAAGDNDCMLEVEAYSGVKLVAKKSMFISDLPVIYIETEKRQPIVSKENELDATIKIQGNSEYNKADYLYDGATKIKGRGNSTWQYDKKPYKLKLDSKANIFGMGKNKHWVLLSNPYDQTHMRNAVGNRLAEEMGVLSMSSVPVELVLNGVPAGSYYICEHVRIDKERVNITNWDDIAEDAAKAIYKANADILEKDDKDGLIDEMTDDMRWTVTDIVRYNGLRFNVSDYYEAGSIDGGYLVCIDSGGIRQSARGLKFDIEKPESACKDMRNSFIDYFNAFEDALFSDDFCTEYNGETMRYTDFIDVDSFVKGFIINEFFINKDFGTRSTYLYKERGEKMVYGPAWDFDYTSGAEQSTVRYDRWQIMLVPWLARFFRDEEFLRDFRDTYWQYRYTAIEDIIKDGGFAETLFEKSIASGTHDEKLWSYDSDYISECEFYLNWLKNRTEWLDKQFETLETLNASMSSLTGGCELSDSAELSELRIDETPSKLQYNAGDEIDLSGLVLTAVYSDGTEKEVEPLAAQSYKKDSVGTVEYTCGTITDAAGDDAYIRLCYDGKYAEYPVSVGKSEDAEAVEALIEKVPLTDLGIADIKYAFEAKTAYDNLTDGAKAQVGNIDRLNFAMEYIDTLCDEPFGIVCAYVGGEYIPNVRNRVVIATKGEIDLIRLFYDDGSTGTFTEKNPLFISKKNAGDFTLWTFSMVMKNCDMNAMRNKVLSETYRFDFDEYQKNSSYINSLSYENNVDSDGKAEITVSGSYALKSVRITENGAALGEFASEGDKTVCAVELGEGVHKLSVEYLAGGEYIKYGDIEITVRKEFGTDIPDELLTVHSLEMRYKSTAALSAASDDVIWKSSDSSVVAVDKNGNITAVRTGAATVTCSIVSANGVITEDTCKVTVKYEWWQWLIRIFLLGFLWY